MKFEIGTLDSNIYQIYTKIMELLNSDISPLELSTVIYESGENYVLVKEVSNGIVLMAVTKSKNEEAFTTVIKTLSGKEFDKLKQYLETS